MNGKIKLISIIYLFFSISLWGSIAPANSLITLTRKELLDVESKLKEIARSIESLETTLGKKNNHYLEIGKQKEINQKNIHGIHSQLLKGEQNLKYRKVKAASELRGLIMGQLDEGSSSASLLVNKVLMKELNIELKQIESELVYNQKLQENLDIESDKLLKYESTQTELLSIMEQMEVQKMALANEYVQAQGNKKNINEKYFKLITNNPKVVNPVKERIETKVERNELGINFFPPVSKPRNVDHQEKGVNFFFSKPRSEVLATQKGKIIYSGALSTFGNVVMIDHGDEARSILLGNFKPLVNKGEMVVVGQVVGESEVDINKDSKVYFEVRKKNVIQKTVNLIDKVALRAAIDRI
jgi:septal ring factor EnvC (AmiA/AmiB activator)